MKAVYSLMSLKKEIPVVGITKEGLSAGGVMSVSLMADNGKPNMNSPISGGTCSASTPPPIGKS